VSKNSKAKPKRPKDKRRIEEKTQNNKIENINLYDWVYQI